MSYLKSWATSFVYISFFLAVITYSPGLPPNAVFSEYSIEPPRALEGVFAQNERLNGAEILFEGTLKGPESFESYNGELYTGLHGGYVSKVVGEKLVPIVKFGKDCGGLWDEEKCGRPVGLKFDEKGQLYVADTYYGIFKVDVLSGKYEKLIDTSKPIDGKIPMLPNSIDVASNGDVYWTDSSTEFKLSDGVFAVLADPAGRLIRYNAATKKNEVLLDKLGFPNGLKLSEDESYVVVAETMKSAIVKYHLKGSKAGKSESLIEGLPGSPDNIHADGFGNYLVSFIVTADPEHPQIYQSLAPHPNIRKMVSRLFAIAELPFKLLQELYPNDMTKKIIHAIGSFETGSFVYPRKATVLRIDGNGKVLDVLHNSDEKISGISSAFAHGDYLWLGSPFNEYLARVPLKQAFPKGDFPSKPQQRVTRQAKAPEAAARLDKPRKVQAKPETTTTTEKPTRTTETTTATTPKPTTTTPKPTTTTTPRPTQAPKTPKPAKVERAKPPSDPKKETGTKQRASESPEKIVETARQRKKVESRRETDEIPKPINLVATESPKPPKQAEKTKVPKKTESTKPVKKTEPPKRNVKLADEM